MRWTEYVAPLLLMALLLAACGCTVSPQTVPETPHVLPGTPVSLGTTSLQETQSTPMAGEETTEIPTLPLVTPAQAPSSSAMGPGETPAGVPSSLPGGTEGTTTVVSAGVPEFLLLPSDTVAAGQVVVVRAATILSPGNRILVEVIPLSFAPTSKMASLAEGGVSGVVVVEKGAGGVNSWSFNFSTRGYSPGSYIVEVSGVEVAGYRGSSTLTVLPSVTAEGRDPGGLPPGGVTVHT